MNFARVALSDLWSRRRTEGGSEIQRVAGSTARPFRNNQERYDARVTDAVIVSTADFQHALHGMEAMQAGQDADIESGYNHSLALVMTIATRQAGRKATFDDRTQQVALG